MSNCTITTPHIIILHFKLNSYGFMFKKRVKFYADLIFISQLVKWSFIEHPFPVSRNIWKLIFEVPKSSLLTSGSAHNGWIFLWLRGWPVPLRTYRVVFLLGSNISQPTETVGRDMKPCNPLSAVLFFLFKQPPDSCQCTQSYFTSMLHMHMLWDKTCMRGETKAFTLSKMLLWNMGLHWTERVNATQGNAMYKMTHFDPESKFLFSAWPDLFNRPSGSLSNIKVTCQSAGWGC